MRRKRFAFTLIAAACAAQGTSKDPWTIAQAYIGKHYLIETQVAGCFHQTGKIDSITAKQTAPTKTTINALGETIAEYPADLPITVRVTCDSGEVGSIESFVSILPMAFHPTTAKVVRDNNLEHAQQWLAALSGQTIYPTRPNLLFVVDSTQAELERFDPLKKRVTVDPADALLVKTGRIWAVRGGVMIALSLTSPDGNRRMIAAFQSEDPSQISTRFLEQFSPASILAPPSRHCWREGDERGYVERGDLVSAVVCQMGEPARKSISDDGTELWVYDLPAETDYVFLDHDRVSRITRDTRRP